MADLRERLAFYGRDPLSFPLQATLPLGDDLDALAAAMRTYLDAGFSRLGLHLPGLHQPGGTAAQRLSVDEHLAQLARVRRQVWASM